MKNFNIIEIKSDRVRVSDNNGTTVVAKYTDSNGDYILNKDLEKQYITEVTPVAKVRKQRESSLSSFQLVVEYWRNERPNVTYRTINAKTIEDAIARVSKGYKNLIDVYPF